MATVCAMGTSCRHENKDDAELRSLYEEIDEEIDKKNVYDQEKEKRISILKSDLDKSETPQAQLTLLYDIISEYEAFQSDSALHYVTLAEHIAEKSADHHETIKAKITKANIEAHAGLFTEAHDMLNNLTIEESDTTLRAFYYSTYIALYQYESEYMPEGEFATRASIMRDIYTDSLLQLNRKDTFDYLVNWAEKQMNKGNQNEVIQKLEKNLRQYQPGDRKYSILASIIAKVQNSADNDKEYRRYLAITVISDIIGAVKENMAIRDLATRVFEDGDIDRANRYVKESLADANFYSGRLQAAQSSRMLPVIDEAYDHQQQKLQSRLRGYLYALAALLIAVIVAVTHSLKQLHNVEIANRKVKESNDDLQKMSEQLRDMNTTLEHTNKALEHSNTALEESNTALEHSNAALEKSNAQLERTNEELKKSGRIAEEYTGLFMEYSSINISNLDKYHTLLRNLAMQGNIKGLLKKLDSADVVNESLKVFYSKFDEAVLHIYPSFVEKINMLLTDEGKVTLKPGEKLNTELRVQALIRLGINDTDQIAQFLRCSVTTVYTYRSKMKRRALNPATFDADVMAI